jgi:hypothetical protein
MIYSLLLIFILFFLPNGIVAPIWKKIRQAWPAGAHQGRHTDV